MINHSSIARTATIDRNCSFIVEPDLSELLHDPMTKALMAADRVDRRALEMLIAGARKNLRWHRPN
jgi:hypothetical protein